MKLHYKSLFFMIILFSICFSCSPKHSSYDTQNSNNSYNNTSSYKQRLTNTPYSLSHQKAVLNPPTDSSYEKYINRWPNKHGVTIDLDINEINKGDNLWFIEAQMIVQDLNFQKIVHSFNFINRRILKFNWLKYSKTNMNIEVPLILPIKEKNIQFIPDDPAVVYNNGLDSSKIDIFYEHVLNNTVRTQDLLSFFDLKIQDKVPEGEATVVIYIYRLDSTYENYKNNIVNYMLNKLNNPNYINIETPRFTANVKDIIELQRFPL